MFKGITQKCVRNCLFYAEHKCGNIEDFCLYFCKILQGFTFSLILNFLKISFEKEKNDFPPSLNSFEHLVTSKYAF